VYTEGRGSHLQEEYSMPNNNGNSPVPIRDFRSHIKEMLNRPHPFTLGSTPNLRAIVCPLPPLPYYPRATARHALAKLKRDFLTLLAKLRKSR